MRSTSFLLLPIHMMILRRYATLLSLFRYQMTVGQSGSNGQMWIRGILTNRWKILQSTCRRP